MERKGPRARSSPRPPPSSAAHGFAGASVDRIARCRPPQQGDDLLPLPQQGGALPRDPRTTCFRPSGVSPGGGATRPSRRKRRSASSSRPSLPRQRPDRTFRRSGFAKSPRAVPISTRRSFRDLTAVLQALQSIIDEGARAGRFRRVNPLVVHTGIVALMLMYFASVRFRERLRTGRNRGRSDVRSRAARGPPPTGGACGPRRKNLRRLPGAGRERKSECDDEETASLEDDGLLVTLVVALGSGRMRIAAGRQRLRATGYVEATEVRVAPEVGGRVLEMRVAEEITRRRGDLIARLDTAGREAHRAPAPGRARPGRRAAAAAAGRFTSRRRATGPRAGGIDRCGCEAAVAELAAAEADLQRFEALLRSNSGSRKQRDDALTRRDVAAARVSAAREHARAAGEGGCAVARRVAASGNCRARAPVSQPSTRRLHRLQKTIADAEVMSPVEGIVTSKLDRRRRDGFSADSPGRHHRSRSRLGEPLRGRTGGSAAQTRAAARDPDRRRPEPERRRSRSFLRVREFTPRNVQTAEERSKLVYRIKVTTDNRDGVLKTGMPVEGRF